MIRAWEPELTIDPGTAFTMIAEQFPELYPKKIRLLGMGWDNTAFLIDEDYVFRFPRRQVAVPLIHHEWNILPKIEEHLPLPIPVPKWIGEAARGFPWPFIGYRHLPGITACQADLSEEERMKIAEPLARFLAALHAIPVALAKSCKLPEDVHCKLDRSIILPKIKANLEELVLLGLLKNTKPYLEIVEAATDLQMPKPNALVHGDFYSRHVLVDADHRISGVIDWGDVMISDPSVDLAIVQGMLPKRAQEKFRMVYGAISEETWRWAHLRALYSAALMTVYGHHLGDAGIVREGKWALQNILF